MIICTVLESSVLPHDHSFIHTVENMRHLIQSADYSVMRWYLE